MRSSVGTGLWALDGSFCSSFFRAKAVVVRGPSGMAEYNTPRGRGANPLRAVFGQD